MKINVTVELNLKMKEAAIKVAQATRKAMRDTVVEITRDAVKDSPWLTGNNRRSMTGEVSGMGMVASGGEGKPERLVDDSKIEGAVYSTSGYGGYLETGTSRMPARPYIRPPAQRHFTAAKYAQKVKGYIE